VFRQDAGGYRGTEPDSTRYAGQQVSIWEIDFWYVEHGNGMDGTSQQLVPQGHGDYV